MNFKKLWFFLAVMIVNVSPIFAQTNVNEEQGMKAYDSWHGGDLDSISMTNRGLVLHIPLASFPQRGNLDLSFFITHSTKQWSVKPAKYDSQGRLISPARWVDSVMGARIVSSVDWAIQGTSNYDQISGQSDWSGAIVAPDGSLHQLGDLVGGTDCAGVATLHALDASGLLLSNCATLIMPNGTTFAWHSTLSSTTGTVTDSNGNQIFVSSSGWTDTLGRVIPGSNPCGTSPARRRDDRLHKLPRRGDICTSVERSRCGRCEWRYQDIQVLL